MSKETLRGKVVLAAREYSDAVILLHQAIGELLGINAADMRCLDLVTMRGSASPTQISRHAGLSTGATTAMLDRLEGAGLVERRRDPDDRRGVLVVLSMEGRRKLESLFEPTGRAMERVVSRFPIDERRVLLRFFAEAQQVLEKERDSLPTRS